MNVKHIEVGLNSNIGLRRKDNQDSACAGNGVYVVCDGMGGGKGGKQASSDVAERFARLAELPTRDLDAIDETLILAQQEVLRLGEQLGGVAGTTISGVLLPTRVGDDAICSDERCYIVNVGDSRTYHMRADGNGAWLADSLTCITRDHSERQNAIDSGQMLPDEASRCIPRNIITQCVGAPAGIQPDWYAARADGRFIICSDGLHAQIGREQLAEIAAACGISRYRTRFGLWLEKTGRAPGFAGNVHTRLGQLCEPHIRQLYANARHDSIEIPPASCAPRLPAASYR